MLTLIDSCFDHNTDGYRLTLAYRSADNHTIRVRVKRNAYVHQSHAIAEVLTPAMTWTTLADQPPSLWWPDTPYRTKATVDALRPVAEAVLQRALAILGLDDS